MVILRMGNQVHKRERPRDGVEEKIKWDTVLVALEFLLSKLEAKKDFKLKYNIKRIDMKSVSIDKTDF